MAEFAPGTTVAGVFTSQPAVPALPVDWCRAALPAGHARALVVNAGNANVFTGRPGGGACEGHRGRRRPPWSAARRREVFLASTGVIGETLPHRAHRGRRCRTLQARLSEDGWEAAARGIMTTDTFPKAATRVATIGGTEVRISGFCKGSGMIMPRTWRRCCASCSPTPRSRPPRCRACCAAA